MWRMALILFSLAATAWPQEVTGRVVEDSSGNPLASVELKFRKPGQHELAADLETDREGRFRAPGLAAGAYTLQISKPNCVTATIKVNLPSPPLQLRLVKLAVISGKATDQQGQPIPGRTLSPGGRTSGSARVVVIAHRPGGDETSVVREAPLGDGGQYRIYDLPPGQYTLGLWWAGLPVGSGAQMFPDNQHPRVFTVSGGEDYPNVDFLVVSGAAYSVSGKVELPKPKTAASLALAVPDLPMLPIGQVMAEEDGTFKFDKIPPGNYDVYAAAPATGYGAFENILGRDPQYGRVKVQVAGQNVEGVTIPLGPPRTVQVILKPKSGEKPPEGCPQSAAVGTTLLDPWGLQSVTQSQANFTAPQTIRDLAPARYRLRLSGLGPNCYQVGNSVVDVSSAGSGTVPIEVASAGSIRGTLKAASARPKDYSVVLVDGEASTGSGESTRVAFPDEQGRFSFDSLRPGRYFIAAQPAADATKLRWVTNVGGMIEVEVVGGAPTEMTLPVSAPKGGGQ